MGQKTHPYAFRIGIVNDWKSRWFNSKDYKDLVNQDYQIRDWLLIRKLQLKVFLLNLTITIKNSIKSQKNKI